MDDSTEYLGDGDGDGEAATTKRPDLDLGFRIAVVVLLLVTAAASAGSYLLLREQAEENDLLSCLGIGPSFADTDGELDEEERRLIELWDCDEDQLRERSE